MAKMSEELIELLNSLPTCYLATASAEGIPNVDPVNSAIAIAPDTIAIAATPLKKTLKNIRENARAALVFHATPPARSEASLENLAQIAGGQVKGRTTVMSSGEVHDRIKETVMETLGAEVAEKMLTIILKIEQIHSITPKP